MLKTFGQTDKVERSDGEGVAEDADHDATGPGFGRVNLYVEEDL